MDKKDKKLGPDETEQLDPDEAELLELAKFYDAHQDDMSIWDTKPRKIRVRRGGPTHTFSVRFTPEEMLRLDAAADAQGITISELIRSAALASITEQRSATLREIREKTRELSAAVDRLTS